MPKEKKKFYKKVWKKITKIPKGKVSTYKAIAEALGTRAYRAVGNACNKNPYAFVSGGSVPCHRVVSSNGSLGGFAHGSRKKIELLKKEGVKVKNRKIQEFERKLFTYN